MRCRASRSGRAIRSAADQLTHPHPTMQLFKRLLILTSLTICAPAQARPVTATVYDSWYSGRTTACGNTYEHWGAPTAAHSWLPCGTPVRVSYQGRSLTVRIRDRCDCASLDLSASAAHHLGVPLDGIATVQISY